MVDYTDQEALAYIQRAWESKPLLRRIYGEQFYSRLIAYSQPGLPMLEIGSGLGFIHEFAPQVIRTDILYSPTIDCAADAHHLPFADETFGTLMGLDVLHHFSDPIAFLKEAARVLRPEGRIVLVEPWITPFSRFVYTYLHQEECDMRATPWLPPLDASKQAFDGNPALPYLLVMKGAEPMRHDLPFLPLKKVEAFSSLTYLLSLGFKPGSLLPLGLYPLLYRLEEITRPAWVKFAALRALLVWEKVPDKANEKVKPIE